MLWTTTTTSDDIHITLKTHNSSQHCDNFRLSRLIHSLVNGRHVTKDAVQLTMGTPSTFYWYQRYTQAPYYVHQSLVEMTAEIQHKAPTFTHTKIFTTLWGIQQIWVHTIRAWWRYGNKICHTRTSLWKSHTRAPLRPVQTRVLAMWKCPQINWSTSHTSSRK